LDELGKILTLRQVIPSLFEVGFRFATIKLYKATLDTFPGATYLFEGAMQFISTFLILVLYFVVKRHERLHGAIGEHQNSKITKTAISQDDSGIEGDFRGNLH